jgi:hypothetical protein
MQMHKIDKSSWGPGAWQYEDDYYEWKYRGLDCHIRRNPSLGTWCGYVTIHDTLHPFFLLDRTGIIEDNIEVHGGITYSFVNKQELTVCFGFDCGHSDDLMPAYHSIFRQQSGLTWQTYKNQAFAIEQTRSMVDQLCEKFSEFHKE